MPRAARANMSAGRVRARVCEIVLLKVPNSVPATPSAGPSVLSVVDFQMRRRYLRRISEVGF